MCVCVGYSGCVVSGSVHLAQRVGSYQGWFLELMWAAFLERAQLNASQFLLQ